MRAKILALVLLVGCTRPTDSGDGPTTGSIGPTADTSVPVPAARPPACESLGSTATLIEQLDVQTEEDFDFDGLGHVVFQDGSAIVAKTHAGDLTVLGSGVTTDPSGIQVAPNGTIIVAGQDSSQIVSLDPTTAATVTLASNVQRPNGLEVGADGIVYVSEFLDERAHIRWIDPADGTSGDVLSDLQYPNGIALTPGEDALVFVAKRPNNKSVVLRTDREGRTDWGDHAPLMASWDLRLDGIETDACGNVYIMDYGLGQLIRIDPLTDEHVVLLTLTDDNPSEHFSSLRWGSGVGGWEADWLYVTDRTWLYAIDPGAPGRPNAVVAR